MKFCFVCGKKTEDMIEGYCKECYCKKFQLIEVPKEIEVKMCGKCMRKMDRNKWREIDLCDIIREKIRVIGESVSLRVESEDDDVGRIYARGFLEGMREPKEEVHELTLKIRKVTCPTCGKSSGFYFETTIQIRGGTLTDEDFDNINDITRNREGFYRLEYAKGGCDMKVSSKSLGKKIAEYVVKKYKIDKKLSFKLVTKKDGRDLYRDTVLLRIS